MEFAIVVPMLLMLVMAIIDFGRMMAVAASLTAAVRDGARTASTAAAASDLAVGGSQLAAVQTRVISAFQPVGGVALQPADVKVLPPNTSGNVEVSAAYRYVPITPLAWLIGLRTVTLNRTATFRWERSS